MKVWIMIGVSVLMTLIGLFYVNRYATIISETSFDQRNRFNRFGMVYNYMIAILLLQGACLSCCNLYQLQYIYYKWNQGVFATTDGFLCAW